MIIDSESFAFGDRKGSVANNELSELDFIDCSHNDISASFNLYFKAARALLTIVFIISFILWVVTASDNEQGGSCAADSLFSTRSGGKDVSNDGLLDMS